MRIDYLYALLIKSINQNKNLEFQKIYYLYRKS